jgi:hypothetical protein
MDKQRTVEYYHERLNSILEGQDSEEMALQSLHGLIDEIFPINQVELSALNSFDAWWSSTNNQNFFSERKIDIEMLRQVSKESFLSGHAHGKGN